MGRNPTPPLDPWPLISYDLVMRKIRRRPGPKAKDPARKYVRKTVSLPPELCRRIQAAADLRGLSFSQVVAHKMTKGRI